MYSLFEKIGRCPSTGRPLRFDKGGQFRTEGVDRSYPLADGIIDLLPESSDKVSAAYSSIAETYDSFLASIKLSTRLYNMIAWGFVDDFGNCQRIMDDIPTDFEGVVLDVPVGTGLYSFEKFQKLKKADIFGLDYSMAMLRQAQRRFGNTEIDNTTLIHADVVQLPFIDSCIDLIISFNGFHAFPNKNAALLDLFRVLKPGARIIGSFYICNERWITDKVVKRFYTNRGWFSPPFFTEEQAKGFFSKGFNFEILEKVKSMLLFSATKLPE